MPTTPNLSEFIIRNLSTPQSFERGQDYYRSGAVHPIVRRGDTLLADVEGSQYTPYRVTIELDAGGLVTVACTCDYDWGGACKHIVAVLLAYIDQPDQIEQRPSINTLLAGLDRDTLHNLLRTLLERQPDLVNWVEEQLLLSSYPTSSTQTPRTPPQRTTPLDTSALRRQIQQAKRAFDHDDFYRVGDSTLIYTLNELLGRAVQFVDGGDAGGGLDILAVLADETLDDWYEYDHDGDVFGQFFEELGESLAEAILTAEFSQEERDEWAERITEWQGGLEEYGIESEAFDVAIGAAVQGWEHGPVQRAMQGVMIEADVRREVPWYAHALAKVRLRVLERQGRTDEYLNLAKAEGQIGHYLTMLVKLGRVQEAIDYGLTHLQIANDALVLAQMLREQVRFAEALRIAEHGLALRGDKDMLARWLRDFAAAQGHAELALRAAHAVFAESLTLADYQAVQSLAGDDWPASRRALLAQLEAKNYAHQRIDIYLYEKMIDEAVKAISAQPDIGYDTLEKVVDTALTTHSDWAIRQCRYQAESIMDSGKSNAYRHALRWLAKARQAYQAAGRAQEWQSYLQGLLDKHRRKYSLIPGLKQLLINPAPKETDSTSP